MKNYLEKIKIGEYVDIVVDGSIHAGMPHLFYHGRTGQVFNVNPKSLGVLVKKQIRNRMIAKRLNIRREHLRKSNCRTAFIQRIKENDRKKTEANKRNERLSTKRQPVLPRGSECLPFNVADVVVHSHAPHMEIH
jgi:large subunit ribosomal protein L21e